MKIATWNVNSIRTRAEHVANWLKREEPDLLFLQELKCTQEQFPFEFFEEIGYQSNIIGQKSYNGVAILSKEDISIRHKKLPGFEEDVARFIEISFKDIIFSNLYAPNGNSGGKEGFAIKCHFIEALIKHAQKLLNQEKSFLFAGDFNICPTHNDFAKGALSPTDALIAPESQNYWRELLWLGLTDGWRAYHPIQKGYSFWGYQNNAWIENRGMRIDAFLLSPKLAQKQRDITIDKRERAQNRPSDHVPLILKCA